jgi:hypothetical protein
LRPEGVLEIVVVFTAGASQDHCDKAIGAAGKLKSDNVLLASVRLGDHCDTPCVRQLASTARYFYNVDTVGRLAEVFQPIVYDDALIGIVLQQGTLSYAPAVGMRLVPDSAVPEATVAPDGSRLDWLWNYLPSDGFTATLRLVPTAPGRQLLAREAGGTWVDKQGRPGAYAVPTAEVDVVP